jgi:hypothetical protein
LAKILRGSPGIAGTVAFTGLFRTGAPRSSDQSEDQGDERN